MMRNYFYFKRITMSYLFSAISFIENLLYILYNYLNYLNHLAIFMYINFCVLTKI